MSTEWTLNLFGDKTGLDRQASMPVWPKSTAYSRHQTESHLRRKIKVFLNLDKGVFKTPQRVTVNYQNKTGSGNSL